MENKLAGSKLAIMWIKSNDSVSDLAHHRYSLIVLTEGRCPRGSWGSFLVEVAFEVGG